MTNGKKIGIALGGGGARGLAHIGVLKVFEREGIKIDYMAGVSMGALVGAYYGLGMDLKELEEEALTFTKRKAIRTFLDFANPKRCLLKGKKINNYIRKMINDKNFSDLKIPLDIIATDLANGEEVVLSRGNLTDAIEASICVPGIFPPIKIKDRYLIDGGVANPTPIDVVYEKKMDVAVGVNLTMKNGVELDNPGTITTLMQSYEIIRTKSFKINFNKIKEDVILISPSLNKSFNSFQFFNIKDFIKAGEDAAEKALPEIMKKIQ